MTRMLGVAALMAALTISLLANTAHAGPKYKILDVWVLEDQFAANVVHYKLDGSIWFYENYIWQGSEGSRRDRTVDVDGALIMDNGQVAPYLVKPDGTINHLPTIDTGTDVSGAAHLASIFNYLIDTEY